jgi:hypothetical protein
MYLAVRGVYQDRASTAYRREPPVEFDPSMTGAAMFTEEQLTAMRGGLLAEEYPADNP